MGKMSDFAIFIDENDLQDLQEKFFDDLLEGYFGFDIINSSTHPLKDAFKLYCEMEYERIEKEKYETMQEEKEKEEKKN